MKIELSVQNLLQLLKINHRYHILLTGHQKLHGANFDDQLKEYDIYDLFLTIAKDFEQKALSSLEAITNKKLYTLLQYYLEGQIEGLAIFREYNYFIDFSHKERQKLKASVLKPHPWYQS